MNYRTQSEAEVGQPWPASSQSDRPGVADVRRMARASCVSHRASPAASIGP